MSEKTRYSDAELEEFKQIILEKLEKAQKDYELLRNGINNQDGNDVMDTSPTFKVLEEGAVTPVGEHHLGGVVAHPDQGGRAVGDGAEAVLGFL